jgi:putative ATPase
MNNDKKRFVDVTELSKELGLSTSEAVELAVKADAVMKIGWPEGRIPLAEACVYLATSPKSNSAYNGINDALQLVRKTGNQPVPLHLRNAPTQLMADLGYHDGYKYPHDYPNNFTPQQYMPDSLKDERLWHAQHSPSEEKQYQNMLRLWGERYK